MSKSAMDQTVNELRLAAYAADEMYQAELVRVYGAKLVGQMRYAGYKHTDAALIAARAAKHEADAAYAMKNSVR